MKVIGQLDAPYALLPGKFPRYALDRGLGGAESPSGRDGEEKNPATAGNRSSVFSQ
jgi:hypothetical protein